MIADRVPRLALDEHVSPHLALVLQAQDVDAVHVQDVGLKGAADPALLRWCQERDRILVTRNYQDFAPLVELLAHRGELFPGVLFLSPGIPGSEHGSHLQAVERWLGRRREGKVDVTGTFGWLR